MMNAATEYPALWGALLVLNWPVYAFVWRQIFVGATDVKRSILAALKPAPFWNWRSEEPWSAGKMFSFLFICGLIISFEYAVLCTLVSMALA
jgi:hypothetical protein